MFWLFGVNNITNFKTYLSTVSVCMKHRKNAIVVIVENSQMAAASTKFWTFLISKKEEVQKLENFKKRQICRGFIPSSFQLFRKGNKVSNVIYAIVPWLTTCKWQIKSNLSKRLLSLLSVQDLPYVTNKTLKRVARIARLAYKHLTLWRLQSFYKIRRLL